LFLIFFGETAFPAIAMAGGVIIVMGILIFYQAGKDGKKEK